MWVWDSQTQPSQVEESSELGRQTAGPNRNHMGGLAVCLSRLDERKVGERELPKGLESILPIFLGLPPLLAVWTELAGRKSLHAPPPVTFLLLFLAGLGAILPEFRGLVKAEFFSLLFSFSSLLLPVPLLLVAETAISHPHPQPQSLHPTVSIFY